MGYDANEDTYATSCDELSDSDTELSSVEQLFKGYEPSLLVLDGSDHALFSQIDELIGCLKKAQLIQQVRVSTAFLKGLEISEADAVFEAIADLAPICDTFICHLHRHLPRTQLQQGGLLKCIQKLSNLTLNNFILNDQLIDALGNNPDLLELRAYFDSKEGQPTEGLDPLLKVLAHSPKLKVLDVYAKEDESPEKPRRVTGEALTALCQNPAIKDLKVWHLDTDLFVAMAKALETNQTLERLAISKCISAQDAAYVALAETLKSNRGLVQIQIMDIVSAQACIALAEGLHHNTTLKELELTYESESDKVGEAMVQMLEDNKTIQELKLYMSYSFENDMSFSAEKGTEYEETEAVSDWESRMDHFLQLNRKGER